VFSYVVKLRMEISLGVKNRLFTTIKNNSVYI